MKNKIILFAAVAVFFAMAACNEKHKNYGMERQDTVKSGDSSNNIQNNIPPKDTLKH